MKRANKIPFLFRVLISKSTPTPRSIKKIRWQDVIWEIVNIQMFTISIYLLPELFEQKRTKSTWKSTPKCTWMCWKVWWSPGAIRWPVADPWCGRGTQCRLTNPKRPRLGFRRSAWTLYPCLLSPPNSTDLNPLDYFVWSYVQNITNMTSHNTIASLITAIRRILAELPPALVKKVCSQCQICIEAVIEAEGRYIE